MIKERNIGVVGLGLMGKGLVVELVQHGYFVTAVRRRKNDNGLENYLNYIACKNQDASMKNEILQNIEQTTDISKLRDCDLVIECINEDIAAKSEIFQILDEICMPETVLASNTSSLSIEEISSGCRRNDKILGIHFMSPVSRMKLVELIHTDKTSVKTLDNCKRFISSLDKEYVVVQDSPGFIVSRLGAVLINEAMNILSEGVASETDIDKAAKLGMNFPLGPLELADNVGLDICLNVLKSLFRYYDNEKYAPDAILEMKVVSGNLGKKSGNGFYNY